VITVADDGVLRSWNVTNGALERDAPLNLATGFLRLLPDGRQLLAHTRDGQMLLWDHQRWQLVHELPGAVAFPPYFNVSDDGRWLSLVTPTSELQLWELADGTLRARTNLPPHRSVRVHCVGPAGETVVRGDSHGVWLWRPQQGSLVACSGRTKPSPLWA
jgi:WD40 repeat protein